MSVRRSPRTVMELIRLSTGYLKEKGVATPRLDAEVLLAHCLGVDRVGLYVNFDRPLQPDEVAAYRELVARRGRREPVAYIVGEKEFMSRPFQVSPAVLIPRPETELLVEAVLERLGAVEQEAPSLLDMGTGSGAIAISLACLLPAAEVMAVDIDPAALEVAKANAHKNGVVDRIDFVQSDLFSAVPAGKSFDCLVSNPPYIPSGDIAGLEAEVQLEPRQALTAGADGLAVIRRLLSEAPQWLKSNGFLAVEIGAMQGPGVKKAALAAGLMQVEIRKDYAGHDRMALMSR